MLTRRERWGLSWRGWLMLLVAFFLASSLFLLCIYPFLAVTQRVDAKVLVVEGWIHEFAVAAAAQEFRAHSYQRVFTTGGPTEGTGGYTNDYNTSASVGADLLKKAGLPAEVVQMVPSRVMDRDRTYGAAVALRNWLREHHTAVQSINVVTEGLHARRTRVLFEKAFGPETSVGIIAVPNPDYDAKHWWRYSEGKKGVLEETAGYVMAKLFFFPKASDEKPVEK